MGTIDQTTTGRVAVAIMSRPTALVRMLNPGSLMSLIVSLVGSVSPDSRTLALARVATGKLAAVGALIHTIGIRDLPAEDLMLARADAPALKEASDWVARADGIVIATPIYKASYSGMLKTFLDMLPQYGLRGKVILPLATGGSLAHVLALDYALRPVLASMGASHICESLFVLDKMMPRSAEGKIDVDPDVATRLDGILVDFTINLHYRKPPQG